MRRAALLPLTLIVALAFAPALAPAAERQPHADIVIRSDAEFDAAHGVRSGAGTAQDPYVISGWRVRRMILKDTSRWVRIVDNEVTFRMVLDWIGPHVEVRRNEIADLRVNQNVRRVGAPTGGVIVGNRFDVVGQLRHFDGIFERNVIGRPADVRAGYGRLRAVNFDGFNGGRFRFNTIYGYMDARLHGHHHSSGFGEQSHMHDGQHREGVDHTRRYHQVSIANNRIHARSEYALSYNDTRHFANDRRAASEQEPALALPHVHHTRVQIRDNVLDGAGILINVFNADDTRHPRTATGSVDISRNRIVLRDDGRPVPTLQGIEVRRAQDLVLRVRGNSIAGPTPRPAPVRALAAATKVAGAGILLQIVDRARIAIEDNTVINRVFGARGARLSESVRWVIRGLRTQGVDQPVAYDRTVANPPEQG